MLVALSSPSPGMSASRVVGGSPLQVQSAPWSVIVKQSVPAGSLLCSGSILDASLVLTAAHCVYDLTGQRAAAGSLSIRAGISSSATPLPGDAEQDRGIVSVRVHPGYVWSSDASPDDVAVLALSAPLDLSGPAVSLLALPAPGSGYPGRVGVGLAGFGREAVGSPPDGSLNWLTGTADEQGECGGFSNTVVPGDDAIAFCAASPASAICSGDSGSSLVRTDTTPPTVIGIASAGVPACGAGSHGVFTYVAAPEILRFIQGDDHPLTAPRRTPATYVALTDDPPIRVGQTLACDSGDWAGEPALTYAFIDSQSGEVLQQGAKTTFVVPARALGTAVLCRVFAANGGGTATLATSSTNPVLAAPRLGIAQLATIAGVRGHTVKVRVVLESASGSSGKFGVCMTPPAAVGGRRCVSQQVDDGGSGGFPLTVALRISARAPLGVARIEVSAVAGISKARTTALVRVGAS